MGDGGGGSGMPMDPIWNLEISLEIEILVSRAERRKEEG